MQLAVDIGNSRVKTGLFSGEELIEHRISDLEPVYAIKEWFDARDDIGAIILSSVRENLDIDLIPIPETIHHVMLDHETPIPLKNHYQTKESLGHDRIALAVGAWAVNEGGNSLIIDAGTCMTIEIVSAEGGYLGGIISPGMKMRMRAMHEQTARLPQVEFSGKIPELIGKSTQECLLSGAVNGMLNEVKGTISELNKVFDDLKVIVTGGDAGIFADQLKSDIFAHPNLVLRGLNKILLHNLDKK